MSQAPIDKLADHHRQQLSAMLDGELRPDQAKFMLRRLEHDRELAACWERWQVCGDILRGRHEALLPADFSHRVAAAIVGQDREAAAGTDVAAPPRQPRWARWGGGAALAASVAMAALFVGREPVEVESAPVPVQVAAASTADADDAGTAARTAPAPAAPLPEAAITLATAVAVAEVPRRVAERRSSRTQQQRAAARARQQSEAPARVAVASASDPATGAPAPSAVPATATAALQPMAPPETVAVELFTTRAPAARPWPRAVLPGFPGQGAYEASYGAGEHPFHPFEPRVDLRAQRDDPPRPTGPR